MSGTQVLGCTTLKHFAIILKVVQFDLKARRVQYRLINCALMVPSDMAPILLGHMCAQDVLFASLILQIQREQIGTCFLILRSNFAK